MICLAHQVFCFHFQVELHFHDHILRRGLFENSILILDFISKSGWWANMVYWISVKSDLNKLDNYGPQNLFLLSGLELPQTWTERKKADKKRCSLIWLLPNICTVEIQIFNFCLQNAKFL